MSPRRTGLPTIAPSSVIVEFHEFDGRWFVTDQWGAGSGVAIKRPARKSALGKAVLSRVWAARNQWRSSRSQAENFELWARFCDSEAGGVDRYNPQKRIVILAGQAGMRCCDARQAPPVWERVPDRSARALGKALIKRINLLEATTPAQEPQPPAEMAP